MERTALRRKKLLHEFQCDVDGCFCVDIDSGEEVPGTRITDDTPNCKGEPSALDFYPVRYNIRLVQQLIRALMWCVVPRALTNSKRNRMGVDLAGVGIPVQR